MYFSYETPRQHRGLNDETRASGYNVLLIKMRNPQNNEGTY